MKMNFLKLEPNRFFFCFFFSTEIVHLTLLDIYINSKFFLVTESFLLLFKVL